MSYLELPSIPTGTIFHSGNAVADASIEQLLGIVDLTNEFRRHFPYGGFELLDTAQVQVLVAVAAFDKPTPTELAASLRFDRSSVSRPLAGLEEARLVRSVVDKRDGRRRYLKLTAKGRRMLASYLSHLSATSE